eukprot:scaffold90070_cov18-Prasinocladus_malaysianus.AAC.1
MDAQQGMKAQCRYACTDVLQGQSHRSGVHSKHELNDSKVRHAFTQSQVRHVAIHFSCIISLKPLLHFIQLAQISE